MASVKDYATGKKLGYDLGDPTFRISIEFVNPEAWNSWANFGEQFNVYYKQLFRQCVYQIHKYLIRVTPIMTGRLRGGWTGILNKYNIDYAQAFTDTSLLERAHIQYDQSAIMEGMAMSQFLDSELDVSIINTVPYAEYVEFGTSQSSGDNFTNRARYKGEYIFKKEFDDWFKEMSMTQTLTKPQSVEEVAA